MPIVTRNSRNAFHAGSLLAVPTYSAIAVRSAICRTALCYDFINLLCSDAVIVKGFSSSADYPFFRINRRLQQHQATVHMHEEFHAVPLHHKAGTVGTKDRRRRISHIPLRIIYAFGKYFFRVMTHLISGRFTGDMPLSSGIGSDLGLIVLHTTDRCFSRDHREISCRIRFFQSKCTMHILDVIHGTSHIFRGKLQPKRITGFQQNRIRLHQSMTHCTIGSLSEISTLGMLQVGFPCHQRYSHICYGCSQEHPSVFLFFQMSQNQTLPVFIQQILTYGGSELQPAPRFSGLHQKMHFRIMTKGLKMAHTLHRVYNGFLIDNFTGSKLHPDLKSFGNQIFQDFDLYTAHYLHLNFLQFFLPEHMQFRNFLFQFLHFGKHLYRAGIIRQFQLVGHNRLQNRNICPLLGTKPLSRLGAC